MIDFEYSLPMLLLRAREATMAHFRPVLKKYGLTEQQWRVLRVLWENNGLESRELAERTLMWRPSLSGVIDRLERDGLVDRHKDKEDGRKTCLWMTRKGRGLYRRITPAVESEYTSMQARFSKKKWDDLYASLFHLVEINGANQK